MIFTSGQNGRQFNFSLQKPVQQAKFAMAPYHILIVIISYVIPENLVLLTKSEQSGPKSAHIRPTISRVSRKERHVCVEAYLEEGKELL